MTRPKTAERGAEDQDRVPFFGTWRAIHLAVLLWAVVVITLLAVFARWPF